MVKVGIIGGSGLNNPDLFKNPTIEKVTTEYGDPSDVLVCGQIAGVDCVLLARHSRTHSVPPSSINFRANICALKHKGCTHILTTTACGSLQEHIKPGEFVILDQFIDRTNRRESTFFDGKPGSWKGVCHIPMAEPYCPHLRNILIESCKAVGAPTHTSGCMVTIEGPRFSTKAESMMYRSWNADVINMSSVPEVTLAKEAGIMYASIAMATDYDCWKEAHSSVNINLVFQTFKQNAATAIKVLTKAVEMIGQREWDDEINAAKDLVKKSVV